MTCLSKILEKVTSDKSIEKSIEEILDKYGASEQKFSIYFEDKLSKVDLTKITNLKAYIEKMTLDIISNNDCKKTKVVVDYHPLINEFHKLGFTGTKEELWLIQLIEDHCINEFQVSPNDLCNVNHAAIEFCKQKNILTYDYYITLLLGCRTLKKCNIPLEHLRDLAKKESEELERILNDIENVKVVNQDEGI